MYKRIQVIEASIFAALIFNVTANIVDEACVRRSIRYRT